MIKLHSIIQTETNQPVRFSYEISFHLRKYVKAIMLTANKGLNSANISINSPADTICRSFYFESLNLAKFYLGLQNSVNVKIQSIIGHFISLAGKWALPNDPVKLEEVTNQILIPSYNAIVLPYGYYGTGGLDLAYAGFAWQGKWYGFNTSSYIDNQNNFKGLLTNPEFATLFKPLLKEAQDKAILNVPKQNYIFLPLKDYSNEIFHINGIVYPNVNGEVIDKINLGIYLQTEKTR